MKFKEGDFVKFIDEVYDSMHLAMDYHRNNKGKVFKIKKIRKHNNATIDGIILDVDDHMKNYGFLDKRFVKMNINLPDELFTM